MTSLFLSVQNRHQAPKAMTEMAENKDMLLIIKENIDTVRDVNSVHLDLERNTCRTGYT